MTQPVRRARGDGRVRRRLAAIMSFVAAGMLLWPGPRAEAQSCVTGWQNNSSCQVNVNISSTIQTTRRLVVAPGTSFSLTPASGQLSVDDYIAGMFDASGAIQLLVQSNAPWRVTMQALSANLGGACTNKSSTSIQWGLTAATRTTPLSTGTTTVYSGSGFSAGQTRDVYLRVGLGWLTDGPVSDANCTLPVSFTIGAP